MDVNKLIDSCIDKTSDYNIAVLIFYLLKNKYRYNGSFKKWQYYDNKSKLWVDDKKNANIINDIQHYISNYFVQRIANLNTNINNVDNELKASKLIICANQLKNKKYILTIIKEARSLFEYNE
jgi:hypothetical protein